MVSDRKRNAQIGQRYYDGDHDIRDYKLYYFNADGELEEDTNKSNIKISHPFFTEMVDQEVQYMLSGKDAFVRSDDPELQKVLDSYFNDNEDFNAELYDMITGTVAKGFDYMYCYKGEDGRTRFQEADSLGVVEVSPKDCQDGRAYVIYWYVDTVGLDNRKVKRIQVWDDEQTWFFVSEDGGDPVPDDTAEYNPRPHIIYTKPGEEGTFGRGYGFIPFFRLDNCRKRYSGLQPIKGLIDDYDLMSCGLSNNIQDTAEALYVVKGFEGNDLNELMKNVRTKKSIGVDENGDVEIRTIDIPYEARRAKLELDEINIYRFGMGFNSNRVGDGNLTNVVIKARYTLLDLKCNKLEIRLKQFMRKLLKEVLKEVNEERGTDYQLSDVYFVFDREVMTNASDNAQIELTEAQRQQTVINTLLNIEQKLGSDTVVKLICEELDIDYNEISDKLPSAEDDGLYRPYNALGSTLFDGSEPDMTDMRGDLA